MTVEEWREHNTRFSVLEDMQEYADYMTKVLKARLEFKEKLYNENKELKTHIDQLVQENLELFSENRQLNCINNELKTTTSALIREKDHYDYIPWDEVPVGHEFEIEENNLLRLKISDTDYFVYGINSVYGCRNISTITEHWPRGEK